MIGNHDDWELKHNDHKIPLVIHFYLLKKEPVNKKIEE
jgi:hypothetical protein